MMLQQRTALQASLALSKKDRITKFIHQFQVKNHTTPPQPEVVEAIQQAADRTVAEARRQQQLHISNLAQKVEDLARQVRCDQPPRPLAHSSR